MTEILLNAILHLFAIQSAMAPPSSRGLVREKVAAYLGDHLGLEDLRPYLDLFDMTLEMHGESPREDLRGHVWAVAEGLRSRLPRREQFVVLARFVEISGRCASGEGPESSAPGEEDRLDGDVARALGISETFVEDVRALCGDPLGEGARGENFLSLLPEGVLPKAELGRSLLRPGFGGGFVVLRSEDPGVWFLRASEGEPIFLDNAPLAPSILYQLKPGSVLSNSRRDRIYFAEIAAAFVRPGRDRLIIFEGEHLEFRYPGSADVGLHDFSFSMEGGQMGAIMGGSGAGKSTLLGVLTGCLPLKGGRLLINGLDVAEHAASLEGVVGYVPQDDLLFDDLTVFENLYYSARLCLAHRSDEEIRLRCEELLSELNQSGTRDIKVGNPLEKTISGGQRKRLNIALELIREPSILLLDEPTSGLSSADSRTVLGLLKAQAAKGRLVLAVVHQPSGEIFKLFDRLWIFDEGGRPIYDGPPLGALLHFRTASYRAGSEEYACPHCGAVNPEQLFEIIEEKCVDDDGFPTKERRVSAEEWHRLYLLSSPPLPERRERPSAPEEGRLERPSPLGQFVLFFVRNFRSRAANRGYLMVNLWEPPLLALLAGALFRGAWGGEYVFRENTNLSGYFFMSVVIAAFLGLSISSEEINKDRKILERERLLNLSWGAYTASKVLHLALVSAFQTGVFVLLGHTILEIPDMYLLSWGVLWSTSCCTCMLGLNISAALKSTVAIYILIPILLVPQIMLGGPTIPYDELIRKDAGNRLVPLVAEFMPTRWGYEALLVAHYTQNRFNVNFVDDDNVVRWAEFLEGSYLPEVRGLASYPFLTPPAGEPKELRRQRVAQRLTALGHELRYLERYSGVAPALEDASLDVETYSRDVQRRVGGYLSRVEASIKALREESAQRRRATEDRMRATLGHQGFEELKNRHFNKEVAKLALGVALVDSVVLSGSRLVPQVLPIAWAPENRWGRAHFLAPFKRLGPIVVATPLFDVGMLWVMALLLYIALWGRGLVRRGSLGRRGLRQR